MSRFAPAVGTRVGTASRRDSTLGVATPFSCSFAMDADGLSHRRILAAAQYCGWVVRSTRPSRWGGAIRSRTAASRDRLYNRLLTPWGDVRVAKGSRL